MAHGNETNIITKTVKLATIAPDPVITLLADKTVLKAAVATPAVLVPKGELIKKPEFIDRAVDKFGLFN